MTQSNQARTFAALHVPGNPLILHNIWDAASADAVAKAGAPAIATGSWAVARAQGYRDGEALPFDLALTLLERVVATVDLPVSFDFEGGYATHPEALAANVRRVMDAGAVGVNFEDQVVGGAGLFEIEAQCARIAALRAAAEAVDMPLFINARTDVFFKDIPHERHGEGLDDAIARAQAYARAGASGFFAPGLRDPALIRQICAASPLPVNMMVTPVTPHIADMGQLGVARVSQGPFPFRTAMDALSASAKAVYGG